MPRPRWFEEGFAELFSTFEVAHGKVRWGQAIQDHVEYLAYNRLRPLQPILSTTSDSGLFNDANRTGLFYAQSWLLTHYLVVGKQEGQREGLVRYLRALETMSDDEAFRTGFGMSYEELGSRLSSYMNGGRYSISILPLPEVPQDSQIGTAPRATVEAALARLAMATGHLDLATQHADNATVLAPKEPGGYEIKAHLAVRQDRQGEAVAAARLATRLGSKDGEMFVMRAAEESDDRERADLLETAINLNPRNRQPYLQLAQVVSRLEKTVAFRRAVPRDRASRISGRNRHRDRARRRRREVRRSRQGAGAARRPDRRAAQGQCRSCQLRRRHARAHRVRGVLAAHRCAGEGAQVHRARTLADELATRSQDDQFRMRAAEVGASVQFAERVYAAETAARAGRSAEARAILEQLATGAETPDQLKRYARDALVKMRR